MHSCDDRHTYTHMSNGDYVENQVHCIVHFFIINMSLRRKRKGQTYASSSFSFKLF